MKFSKCACAAFAAIESICLLVSILLTSERSLTDYICPWVKDYFFIFSPLFSVFYQPSALEKGIESFNSLHKRDSHLWYLGPVRPQIKCRVVHKWRRIPKRSPVWAFDTSDQTALIKHTLSLLSSHPRFILGCICCFYKASAVCVFNPDVVINQHCLQLTLSCA